MTRSINRKVDKGTRQLMNIVLSLQTKKVVLRLECASCKTKHQLTLKRCKQYVPLCRNSLNHHLYHSITASNWEVTSDRRVPP